MFYADEWYPSELADSVATGIPGAVLQECSTVTEACDCFLSAVNVPGRVRYLRLDVSGEYHALFGYL